MYFVDVDITYKNNSKNDHTLQFNYFWVQEKQHWKRFVIFGENSTRKWYVHASFTNKN